MCVRLYTFIKFSYMLFLHLKLGRFFELINCIKHVERSLEYTYILTHRKHKQDNLTNKIKI